LHIERVKRLVRRVVVVESYKNVSISFTKIVSYFVG
jgi:hypothetical protein